MIAIGLSKQQAPDADPEPIQQINFTENPDQPGNTTTIISITEKVKETILDFLQVTKRIL